MLPSHTDILDTLGALPTMSRVSVQDRTVSENFYEILGGTFNPYEKSEQELIEQETMDFEERAAIM